MKRVFLPVERLQMVQSDLESFRANNALNGYQTWILDSLYDLNVPALDFPVRSICLVASPNWPRQDATFTFENQQRTYPAPGLLKNAEDTDDGILRRLRAEGMRAQLAGKLPLKRLAVCAGLAVYGRNNVTYVEGMGSYHTLSAFYTDVACGDPWRGIVDMEGCASCGKCMRACPTHTILEDRFLIDNQRCLTSMNQDKDPEVFPDWVPLNAHTCVVECLICQSVCPVNEPYRSAPQPVLFDAEETDALLRATPYEALPDSLRAKIDTLGWRDFLEGLPRNLRALFAQQNAG